MRCNVKVDKIMLYDNWEFLGVILMGLWRILVVDCDVN